VIRGQIDRARHLLALSERSVTDFCMEVARRIRNSGEALRRFIRQTSIMRIKLTSIMVDDQDQGLEVLYGGVGFREEAGYPVGEFRWITVVSAEGPGDVELALEPNANPVARPFRRATRNRESRLRCAAHRLAYVDHGFLTDAEKSLPWSVEVSHEPDDRAEGQRQHDRTRRSARRGQAGLIAHGEEREQSDREQDNPHRQRHAAAQSCHDSRSMEIDHLVQ
jgi:hypothetical protein